MRAIGRVTSRPGRPQPAIQRLADAGELIEPVLDSGCGSGEHVLLAASMGLEVTGCLHTFPNADRPLYAASLASVVEPGGVLHLLCFSELTPGTDGPRRVTEGEIHGTFARDWVVEQVEQSSFAVSNLWSGVPPSAWLARIVRR